MKRRHERPTRAATLLASVSLAALLQSCVSDQGNRPHTLRLDYPRGPGSFCALNPEGCPPPTPRQPEGSDSTASLSSCLKACEAGGETLRTYCRRLKDSRKRSLCWSVVLRPKTECINMCHSIHGCGDSGDCAHAPE
jgi:hypothetical protein